MNLLSFPDDVFILIVERLVATIGICKAVQLRSVNSKFPSLKRGKQKSPMAFLDVAKSDATITLGSFNSTVMLAICGSQVIDINDPATPYLSRHMTPPLKGKILLAKSRSSEVTEDDRLSVIASVNQALDGLTHASEERRLEQHQMIAEAVAHKYRGSPFERENANRDISVDIEAQNLLCGAIVLGNMRLVNYLLQQRPCALAAVNTESPYFGQPLQLAAAWDHIDVVRYLLACGADPHRTSEDSEDGTNWVPDMKLGMAWGSVYRNPSGSALRAAVLTGHNDIAHLLLEPQYRLSHVKVEYFRAVLTAAQTGNLHLIELLIKMTGKTLSNFSGLGQEMLYVAAYYGQQEVVRMLLESGVSGVDVSEIPSKDVGHEGALSLAAQRGNATMVSFLLAHGAEVNFSLYNQSRHDPIHAAAIRGHQEVVEILLEHGDSSERALRNAADGGQLHLVKWLLNKDPKLPRKTWPDGREVGKEALQRAIVVKSPEVITLLVNSGVPLNDGYEDWEIPIVWAKQLAADWIVNLLLALGAENRDVDEDTPEDVPQNHWEGMRRGGVRLTQRTWEWASKY
ncbi:uncharacterized protein BP5553_02224 [Venustampulla echinocandica]|uniref:Uncharacterized protein n=1 Tax=Venustampulla echinocandica TaxID=2656787 RepID=A0A370U3A6_9HELO|nr:uncharacterized protein BP5553_02224 [Venustampulla echinocandica]RDL42245.1 hypothetical protein BP5553_02224 [Venustampulla echinocandica]